MNRCVTLGLGRFRDIVVAALILLATGARGQAGRSALELLQPGARVGEPAGVSPTTRPATQPAGEAAAAGRRVYVWAHQWGGGGWTREGYRVGDGITFCTKAFKPEAVSGWNWGPVLREVAANGYPPICVDEDWSDPAASIDAVNALATKLGLDASRIRWLTFNIPGAERAEHSVAPPAGAKDPYYDAFVKGLAEYPKSPVSSRLAALNPSFYPYEVDMTIEQWNAFVDVSLPHFRRCAARCGKPVVPIVAGSVNLPDGKHVKWLGRAFTLGMLERLVVKEGLDVVFWINPDEPGNEETRNAVWEFCAARRAKAVK